MIGARHGKTRISARNGESVAEAKAKAIARPPAFAVFDLWLSDGNGLDVKTLHAVRPDCRVVVLTGYGAISTAVAAVKIRAIDQLPKPADADDVTNALLSRSFAAPEIPDTMMQIGCDGSISSASKCPSKNILNRMNHL